MLFTGMWKRKRWKWLNFCGSGSIFHKTWFRDVEAEAVKFLRKHFEERSWKRKQKIFYCFHISGCTVFSSLLFLFFLHLSWIVPQRISIRLRSWSLKADYMIGGNFLAINTKNFSERNANISPENSLTLLRNTSTGFSQS